MPNPVRMTRAGDDNLQVRSDPRTLDAIQDLINAAAEDADPSAPNSCAAVISACRKLIEAAGTTTSGKAAEEIVLRYQTALRDANRPRPAGSALR